MMAHPLVVFAKQTCCACPEQWEGKLAGGWQFYFRYRSGIASIGVGPDEDSAVSDPHEMCIEHGDSLQGAFESPEVRDDIFAALLDMRMPPAEVPVAAEE